MPSTYKWDGSKWVDNKTGATVDPEVVANSVSNLPNVTPPASLMERIVAGVGQMAPRVAMQVGGAELGGALGTVVAPGIGTALGAMAGGALGNYLGSKLPPAIGGNPKESATSSLLWGGLPEGIARGLAGAVESKALNRGANAAYDTITEALSKEPAGAVQAQDVAGAVGRQSLNRPPVVTGTKLTDQANVIRDPVLNSINKQRRALGEPIGKAYDALKGNNARISDQEAADLAYAARGVQEGLVSPAPAARSALARVKGYQPPPPPKPFTPDANFYRMSPEEQQAVMDAAGSGAKYQPPTLDELRELRQQVNTSLRSAKGGDAHALLNLQQAIDEKLLPHLPPDIGRSRQLYAGFISRFPWRDTNRIRQMGTPREIGAYVFGGTPERAHEIIAGAGQGGRQTLKEALTDHLLNSVDPDATPEEQVAQIQKGIAPYIANGTARTLYGSKAGDLREILSAPIHRVRMAKLMQQPAQQEAFVKGWTAAVKGAKADKIRAAEAGMQKFYDSLPPAEKAYFTQPPVPGAQLPVLPETHASLTEGLQPGKSTVGGQMSRRLKFTGPYAVSRLALGGGGAAYAVAQAATFGAIAAGSPAYRAIMENGGASSVARMYASKNGATAGRLALETLAAMGSQAGAAATASDQDDDK